jgi:hypothetical protein
MAGFSLGPTMDAIAKTIVDAGLTKIAYAYLPKSIVPPCVIVNYPRPGEVEFNQTFKHGMYKATFLVDFVVGNVNGLAARDALSDILDGAVSVAEVLESDGTDLAATVDTVDVNDAGIVFLASAAGDAAEYLAARFTVEVSGS